MNRRDFLQGAVAAVGSLGALPSGAADPVVAKGVAKGAEAKGAEAFAQIWRREGGVLMIRHAATVAGVGDPPGFVLGQCSTQRNLSDQGRQESRQLGAWMRTQRLQPDAVLSSQWCRCQDTARLAFGAFEDWSPLNSTFAGQGDAGAQERAMRERLQNMPAGRREVWVTHQVNMTALTDAYPGLGEGFLVDRHGRLLARGRMP